MSGAQESNVIPFPSACSEEPSPYHNIIGDEAITWVKDIVRDMERGDIKSFCLITVKSTGDVCLCYSAEDTMHLIGAIENAKQDMMKDVSG